MWRPTNHSQAIIILNGPMGAGKTTCAHAIFEQLPEPVFYLQVDAIKCSMKKTDMRHRIVDQYSIAHAMAKRLVGLGYSIVIDKVASNKELGGFATIAAKASIPCYKFLFSLPLEKSIQRVQKRKKDQGKSFAKEDRDKVIQSHNLMNTIPAEEYILIDASQSLNTILTTCLEHLELH